MIRFTKPVWIFAMTKYGKDIHVFFQDFTEKMTIVFSEGKINWPREIKLCKRLWAAYPDLDFWKFLQKRTKFDIPSLAWFFTKEGKEYIRNIKNEYGFDKSLDEKPKNQYDYGDVKIGEDKILKPKRKNTKEFLCQEEDQEKTPTKKQL